MSLRRRLRRFLPYVKSLYRPQTMSMIKNSTGKVASTEFTAQKPDTSLPSRSSLSLSDTTSLSEARPLLPQFGAKKVNDETPGSILKKHGANIQHFTYHH
ncbi:hypothetical protein BG006_001212 [Podila minutissima]|uniref:Uncharacterized protein n=1 Tax=Podila minutissima TaxID=64525 RepID=A0A9P5VH84_9FUNG|nr:hypothetical protein BG006_001212 [Podila minutissima]